MTPNFELLSYKTHKTFLEIATKVSVIKVKVDVAKKEITCPLASSY
jgi:hypothetical protein